MNKINIEIGHITLALAILLLGAALQRAQSAEAIFLSSNDEMHFGWRLIHINGDPGYALWACAGPSNALT